MNSKLSIRKTWIWTYFIVIIAMGLFFLAGLSVVRKEIEDKARKNNYDNAVFMKNSLDESWGRVFDYSLQIINNRIAKALDTEDGDWSHDAYALSQDIRNYINSNVMVKDVLLYYPGDDKIIGVKGVYMSHTYWASLNAESKEPEYDVWMNRLFGNRTPGYFMASDGNINKLYYRISTPDITGRILVARINTDELQKLLNNIRNDNEHAFLAMTDEKHQVLSYSGDAERFIDKETNTVRVDDTKHCVYNEIASDVEGLCYVTATETRDLMATSRTVTMITLIVLAMSVAIGIVVLILLVNHNAKPIERIFSKLASGTELTGNELEIIDEQIDDLMEKNRQSLNKYVHEQKAMKRRTFLNDSLRFGLPVNKDIETLAALYAVNFKYGYYRLIIRERTGDDYSIAVNEYLSNMNEKEGITAWTQKQDLDIFLLNFDFDAGESSTYAKRVGDTIRNQLFGSKSNVVESEIFSGLEELRSCYLKCLRQLNRKEMVSISEKSGKEGNFEDMQTETAIAVFKKSIIDEDYESARKELKDVCIHEDANTLSFRCRKYAIIAVLRAVKDEQLRDDAEKLDAVESQHEFMDVLDAMLQSKIDSKSEEDSQADENDIAGRARMIIDEHYNNPTLGLCMIAENMGLSQSYVSRIFNKKYKIGIPQYINQVRLQRAKQLICEGELSIKEIALKIGFISDAQFIRVFKKYENMTPGAYRDMMMENK